jgi:hypothetical protein
MQPNICAIQKVKGDMTRPPPSGTDGKPPLVPDGKPPQRRDDLPPEILEVIWPALQVGGLSGMYLNLM